MYGLFWHIAKYVNNQSINDYVSCYTTLPYDVDAANEDLTSINRVREVVGKSSIRN